MKDFLKYDLHIHTKYSPCSNLEPGTILKVTKKLGFNGIAITDHHELKGAREVDKLNKDKNFEVIIGTEIDTSNGSILAYYINTQIKSKKIPEILDEIHDQGGLAVIAHPFRKTIHNRHYFSYPINKVRNKIDAIEAINCRNFFWQNSKAIKHADQLKLPKLSSSDAHFSFEIGSAYTLFEDSLIKALNRNDTQIYSKFNLGPIASIMSFFYSIPHLVNYIKNK